MRKRIGELLERVGDLVNRLVYLYIGLITGYGYYQMVNFKRPPETFDYHLLVKWPDGPGILIAYLIFAAMPLLGELIIYLLDGVPALFQWIKKRCSKNRTSPSAF